MNTTQKEVLSETESENQKVVETEIQLHIAKNISAEKNTLYRRLSIKYNTFMRDMDLFINNFIYQKIEFDNGNILLFSYNLVKNISNIDSAIIVRLRDNIYMLDHSSLLNHYIYMFRVYTLNGVLINHTVFIDSNRINFDRIFNYKLITNDKREFNLAYIIFGIDDDITPVAIQHIEPNVMNDLDALVNLSNISIFKIDDPIVMEIITRTGDIDKSHRLINISNDLIHFYSNYLRDFYLSISKIRKITDNTPIIRRGGEETTEFRYDLMFNLNNMNEIEYYTLAC
jgi:hypothetical protein